MPRRGAGHVAVVVSVIAAGAVVADDLPAQSLVTGKKATVRRRW